MVICKNNFKIKLFLFFITLLFSINVCAKQIELKASSGVSEVDSKGNHIVYLGEPFDIEVVVSADKSAKEQPKIEGLENFKVFSSGSSQFMTFVNNVGTFKVTYSYSLICQKEGIFSIGPATIVENNDQLKSDILKIKVIQRKGEVSLGSVPGRSDKEVSHKVLCNLSCDKQKIVLGEATILSVQFFFTDLQSKISIEMPNLSEFIFKEIKKSTTPQKVRLKNADFYMLESQFVLTPLTVGVKEIAPFRVFYQQPLRQPSGRFGNFFDDSFFAGFMGPSYKEHVIASNKLSIKVNDLPAFRGKVNGVGSFSKFKAFVDVKEVFVNEPFTLFLEIDGVGNFDQIEIPKLELSEGFKSYTSKNEFKANLDLGVLCGSKRFEYIIQAGNVGEVEIKPQKFIYFDLKTQKYKTLESNSVKLMVKASNEQVKSALSIKKSSEDLDQKLENVERQEINFIEEENKRDQLFRGGLTWWLFWVLLFLPLLFFIQPFLSNKIVKLFKSNDIFHLFKKQLRIIRNKNNAEELYALFLDFFSQKFNISRNEIAQDVIFAQLKKENWLEDEIKKFLDFLNICASVSYSSSHFNDVDKRLLLDDAEGWLLKISQKRVA